MATGRLRKVTLLLPDDLIQRAMEVTGDDLTPTICQGLESIVAAKSFQKIRSLRGKVKFSIDLDSLRRDFE